VAVTPLLALLGALSVLTAYLIMLTIAALFAKRHGPPPGSAQRRFAILIPAHNEQMLIGRLLTSLQQLDYPVDRREVCVVADNCTDATAELARSMDARVYTRVNSAELGKGFALRWLLEQLHSEARAYDAYLVLDADTVVQPNLLRCMDARLQRGSEVMQAYYSVLNAGQSTIAGLRMAALAAIHYVRPLGRSVFGLSCGLKGNGMCFAATVLDRFGWRWFTLAEDVEFHLELVKAGIRVDFVPETTVFADMPTNLKQAASQNARWEGGRLQMLQRQVPALLRDGLAGPSPMRLDAAIEQLIPPLSVPFAFGGLCLVVSVAIGASELAVWSGLTLLGQIGYLLVGLVLVGAPWRTYLSLSAAPVYILWKVSLYGRALIGNRQTTWVRTARAAPDSLPHG
jgi:cellulose synthase/poly-beta-1,6-N-acetylglucosamine synthase-like glycosyltransferase